ncbi:hypothetical protein FOZ62_008410, partial [Perkinsus olseni]
MSNDNPTDQLPREQQGPDRQLEQPRHVQLPAQGGPTRRSWTRWEQHEDDCIISAYVHWLNPANRVAEKKLRYQPLLRELQQLHPDCTIQLLVVVVGVTGGITKQLARG